MLTVAVKITQLTGAGGVRACRCASAEGLAANWEAKKAPFDRTAQHLNHGTLDLLEVCYDMNSWATLVVRSYFLVLSDAAPRQESR